VAPVTGLLPQIVDGLVEGIGDVGAARGTNARDAIGNRFAVSRQVDEPLGVRGEGIQGDLILRLELREGVVAAWCSSGSRGDMLLLPSITNATAKGSSSREK
jgi:hypothetical protein